MGLARTATRMCSPKLEEHDPDTPTEHAKNSINSCSHPTASSCFAGDMVSRNMAATMQAGHRTGNRAKDCTKAQRSLECEQRATAACTRHHYPHLPPAAFRQAQNENMLTTALYPNWWAPLTHTECWKPSTSSRIAGTLGQLTMKVPEIL
jgi:hypothetical protein